MKLTKAQLRKLVRANLSETPLMDILPFKNKRDDSINVSPRAGSSIGYRIPSKIKGSEIDRRKQFTDAAKFFLEDSEDNWYIIVLKNVGQDKNLASDTVNSPDFKQWISSLNIPKKSKILVVGRSSYLGDFLAPEWQIVHDIIGHTIDSYYMPNIKFFKGYQHLHGEITWTTLPDEFKISKSDIDDRLPDIFAAIFANKFDREKAVSLLNSINKPGEELCDALYNIVELWKMSIPYDKPTIIYPF
jgi:hypothetical protein